MPRPKVKTRLTHLAEAHQRLLQAHTSLMAVDLRTTRGELRDALRTSREANEATLSWVQAAIEADTLIP